jgi:hypothetical protein
MSTKLIHRIRTFWSYGLRCTKSTSWGNLSATLTKLWTSMGFVLCQPPSSMNVGIYRFSWINKIWLINEMHRFPRSWHLLWDFKRYTSDDWMFFLFKGKQNITLMRQFFFFWSTSSKLAPKNALSQSFKK